MPSIIHSGFKYRNAANFVFLLGSNTYMFIGKTTPWTGSNGVGEYNPPDPVDTPASHRDHWKNMIALKKVEQSNVCFAIKRYDWTGSDSFDVYSDTDNDLFRKRFYCYSVNSGENGRVYKCIAKTPTAGVSTQQPTGNSRDPEVKSDGYTWKFMYEIPTNLADKFITPQFIPVVGSLNSTNLWPVGAPENSTYPINQEWGINKLLVGHGGDNLRELGAFYVIVHVDFAGSEGSVIPVNNDYRTIGLIDAVTLNVNGNPPLASGILYDTTTRLNISGTLGTNFTIDAEVVVNEVTATVVDTSTNFIKVNNISGNLANGAITQVGNSNVTGAAVVGVVQPQVKHNSGRILFVEQRSPISRALDQTEALNIVLEF